MRLPTVDLTKPAWGCVLGQVGFVVCLGMATWTWMLYRRREIWRIQRQAERSGRSWGEPLEFQSPDDIPRHFVQYSFRSSWIGSVLIYSWLVFACAGYLVIIWGCYIAYVVTDGSYFPPSAAFWQDFFGDWDGLMVPWCLLFTLVHLTAGFMSKFRNALRARSLLPVDSMEQATHIVVDEDVFHETSGESEGLPPHGFNQPILEALRGRYHRALTREVLHVQVVHKHAVDGSARDEDQPTVESEERPEKVNDEEGSILNTVHGRRSNSGALLAERTRQTRLIEYTCVRYIFCSKAGMYLPQGQWNPAVDEVHAQVAQGGLSSKAAAMALAHTGPNEIKVKIPSVFEALTLEFSDFTMVFNSIGIWSYVIYSAWNIGFFWLLMAISSGLYRALRIVRPSQQKVAEMARMQANCEVLRDGKWITVAASQLALGDVVKVQDEPGSQVPCDGILVAGSLVVNESMLTGEPMPVAKASVDKGDKAEIAEKLNKACAGTLVLESTGPYDGKAAMVVTSVGASTVRGQMVRMVLFPSDVRFKYTDQLPVVYAIMTAYAAVIVYFYLQYSDMGSWGVYYLGTLNTIAQCLSPMLPVSIVMGQSVSANRLSDPADVYKIKCLQPGRIPIAGKVSTMVFDKTGTITRGSMGFAAVISVQKGKFGARVNLDASAADSELNHYKLADQKLVPAELLHGLATCHTVKLLKTGDLVGNQVECCMVWSCGWHRSGPHMISPQGETIKIVRELEFDHHRMTSGTVIRSLDGSAKAYIKGSYERIKDLATPTSVPRDYVEVTTRASKDNYYVLAIASKELPLVSSDAPLANLSRNELESNLEICGLLLFRNEIKADSAEAIQRLRSGGVRSVMCTGDSELTGISVGRKCGIVTAERCLRGDMKGTQLVWTDADDDLGRPIDPRLDFASELAVTYSAWRHLLHEENELLAELWPRLVIFGRMKPTDKISVVKFLQRQGLVVGMAGDGGNDCGGLRAAHVGLALSDSEASLVSPFSTGRMGIGLQACKDITLHTMPDLIQEGRACLSTNLATFRYFMVYGLIVTSLTTITSILNATMMSEWVWVSMDVGVGVTMVYFMTQSRALPSLASYRPTGSLFGIKTMLGIVFPVVTCMGALWLSYRLLWEQDWYDPLNPSKDIQIRAEDWLKKGDNYDAPVQVLLTLTTLSTTAYVSSYGGDFRRSIFSNIGLNVIYGLFLGGIFFVTLAAPNRFNCIYRVNCDTESSLAGSDIPFLHHFSAGGTGGCFLGPQVKYWQRAANFTTAWQPSPEEGCLPPQFVLKKIPVQDSRISSGMGYHFPDCHGPNNCYSPSFKWTLASILAAYVGQQWCKLTVHLWGEEAGRVVQARRTRPNNSRSLWRPVKVWLLFL